MSFIHIGSFLCTSCQLPFIICGCPAVNLVTVRLGNLPPFQRNFFLIRNRASDDCLLWSRFFWRGRGLRIWCRCRLGNWCGRGLRQLLGICGICLDSGVDCLLECELFLFFPFHVYASNKVMCRKYSFLIFFLNVRCILLNL